MEFLEGARRAAVGASFALLLVARSAHAVCEIADTCQGSPPVCTCPGTGECLVSTQQEVPAGAVIDCSGRDIRIKDNYGRIEVRNGFVTVRAHNLRIENDHRIIATRDTDVPFGINVELTGKADIVGVLEANSDLGGGSIHVSAEEGISFPHGGTTGNAAEARGTAAGAPGGDVTLESDRHVDIDDPIYADTPTTNSVSVASGGTVEITAAGNITVGGKISVFGRQAQAGRIRLTAEGKITCVTDGGVETCQEASDPEAVACGDGTRTGKIIVETGSPLLAEGGNTNGHGGEIQLAAREIQTNAKLSAQGGLNVGGGFSEGGSVILQASDCGLSINDEINVTGGEGGSGLSGGAIVAETPGDLTIGAGVKLITKSDANGGDGGDISLTAAGALTINDGAELDARGHTGGGNLGNGADIEVDACSLSVNGTVALHAEGYVGGRVLLIGRDSLTLSSATVVGATGSSSPQDGTITLRARPSLCSNDATLTCAVDDDCCAQTCEVGAPPGWCSNDPSRACSSDPDCNIGCQSGDCLFGTCSNSPGVRCNIDATCEGLGCQVGSCQQRIETGTAQFAPAAQKEADARLAACGE